MAATKSGAHSSRSAGRSCSWNMIALLVPPRMKTAGMERCLTPRASRRRAPSLTVSLEETRGETRDVEEFERYFDVEFIEPTRREIGQRERHAQESLLFTRRRVEAREFVELSQVVVTTTGRRATWMGVRDVDLVFDGAAVLQGHHDAPAEGPLLRVFVMVFLIPLGFFNGADLLPQRHGVGLRGPCSVVAVHVVPGSVLEGHREDVHQAVVQGLARGVGVELLLIARPAADDAVRVVTGVDHALFDLGEIVDSTAEAKGHVDPRLRLDFSGVRLGAVSYTHLRAHETGRNLVCRLLL